MSETAKKFGSNFKGFHHPVVDFWRREVGGISSRNFSNRFSASENLVLRFEVYRKLEKHKGCVNTVSFNADGDLLISGSDDRHVILWDWQLGKVKLSFHSGHGNNVFQAKFMPFSDDRTIVTCAADGMVRCASILEDGKVDTRFLGMHQGRAHKLCIEPGNPHIFYTCGEDGLVQRFDLRTEAPTELFTCQSADRRWRNMEANQLNAIAIDPRNSNLFAVGGMDEYARLYDIRRIQAGDLNGLTQVTHHFCPPHLIGNEHVGITGLAFSEQSELLVSYNDEFIYLFTPDMGLGSNPIPSSRVSKSSGSKSETASSPKDDSKQPVPLVYKGHKNCETVKGVNFFGPWSEYVVSGSDCGRIFIWRKKSGELIRVMEADRHVVNCIEPHPHSPVLASSGIESDIKVWTSTAKERAILPENIELEYRNIFPRENEDAKDNDERQIPLNIQFSQNFMAANLLSRCYNCDACKCVSSENHQTTGTKRNVNRNLEFDRRLSKPARLVLRDKSKLTKQLNDPSLTHALRVFTDSGLMENALQLFDEMNKDDVFVWNVIIRGFTSCGLYIEAVKFYFRMVFAGIKADSFTYPFVIKSVAEISSLEEGKMIHAMVIKLGFVSDVYVCNSLISLYMKLECACDAEKVFEEMPERDIVSWNSMISGYLSLEDGLRSLMLFKEMLKCGFKPNRISTMSALGVCSHVYSPKIGKEIHCHAIRSRIETGDIMVLTSILDMYSKYGEVNYAERVFNGMIQRNIVAWNVMVGCYARNGRVIDAFLCFQKMSEQNGLQPDFITLINLLPACAILEGQMIHGYAMRRGLLPCIVLETALIDMYGECGQLKSAEVIFDRMDENNLVSWNSMIAAYVQNGKSYSALELFQELWDSELVPDSTTIASILPAYAESLSLSEGRQLHGYIVKSRYGSNTIILNSLVHVYAMCGDLEDARKCFDHILLKDVVSWNSIIMAYAVHGFGRISICLFSEMITSGVNPNNSTFASLLAACSISGMVDEGWEYFNLMKREYGIDPGIEHYGYMLDLIGRTGNFNAAKRLIEDIPFVPTARIWGSLLNASRNHNNITVAEFAAEQIFEMEHDNTGCYVLLLNMYAEAGRWEDVNRIKLLMKSKGISRTTSRSTVETKSKTHVFTNGDRSHVEANKIYEVLDIVSRMIGEEEKEDSYVHCVSKLRPETLLKSRRNSPRRHSVRLATSLGLISTETGRTVMLRNNTRICRKCHEFLEKVSKMTRREIVVKDSKIFHHFSDGRCSCGNYW